MESPAAQLADFQFHDVINIGSFCEVVLCSDSRTSQKYAAKRVVRRGKPCDQAIVMEAHCLRRLRSNPLVAKLVCDFDSPAEWVGILEWCQAGELWEAGLGKMCFTIPAPLLQGQTCVCFSSMG